MKLRTKFHLTLYLAPLLLFIGNVAILQTDFSRIGLFLFDIFLIIIYFIVIQNFNCPRCHVKLIDFYNCLSRHYKGFHYFLKNNCLNCGEELK